MLRECKYRTIQGLSMNAKKFVSQVSEQQKFSLPGWISWIYSQCTETVLRLPNQLFLEVFRVTVGCGMRVGVWLGNELERCEK